MTSTIRPLSEPYGSLSYREVGQGAPLVLVHGVGMQSAAWGPQIDALSRSHRVIALDMPGHGGSSPLPEGAKLPDFVAWLAAVFRDLDLEDVSLAGHSMGALIALGFAIDHPERLARVALLNGVYRRSIAARSAVEARADEIKAGIVDFDTPLSRWFGDSPSEQAARADVAAWLGQVDLEGYATAYGAFARGDQVYADRLAEITCPFLAITGDGDPNSTPEMTHAMADAVAHGRALVISGHRHMVNLTAPDVVTAAMQTWLDWREEGSADDRD